MTTIQLKVPNWLDQLCTWPVMVYRKNKYGYDFRRIYLGESVWTIVDADVYYRLGHFKWYVYGRRGKFYAGRYVKVGKLNFKILPLHREIMNAPKRRIVDHQNGESLDNRRANLRFATHAQNSYNRGKMKRKTSSRFVGACFEKRYRRWVVSIEHKSKTYWIGRFKSEVEAAKAYDRAALKFRGEFARTNFPRETYMNEDWYEKMVKAKKSKIKN